MSKVSFLYSVLGRPLASEEEDQQRLGVLAGIPVFGLDALRSAASGPEAALTVLLPRARPARSAFSQSLELSA